MSTRLFTSLFFSAIFACISLACGTTDLIGDANTDADGGTDESSESDPSCWDRDEDGYLDVACGGDDCDDEDPLIHPGANPDCEGGRDFDCDGLPDRDEDSDGHVTMECSGDDCDDTRFDTYTGAFEICGDGIDQDCDGMIDERINPYGEVRITEAAGDSILPNMVWTGSVFGLVWRDEQINACDVFFTLLDPVGTKLLEDRLVASLWCDYSEDPISLIWTGSEFGMVWDITDYSFLSSYFTRISASGDEIGDEIPIETSSGPLYGTPSMAWTGSEYGLAYTDGDVFFDILSDAGTIISETRIVEDAPFSGHPSLAWTSSGFGVAWTVYATDFAILNPMGGRLLDMWYPRYDGISHRVPDLVWMGDGFGIAWEIGYSLIKFSRIDPSGSSLGEFEISSPYEYSSLRPSLSWTGSNFGLAWQDTRFHDISSHEYEIFFTVVEASGNDRSNDYRITNHDGRSEEPVVEWTGSEFGISWQDDRDGNFEIYYVRVTLCE